MDMSYMRAWLLIKTMSEKCRKIIEMRDRAGESYADIGKLMKIPIGTVMSRLHRGRKAMQKALYEFAVESGLVERPDAEPGPEPTRTHG